MASIPELDQAADTRRDSLLDAAVVVFSRYGFRKTSMDEVARAAGVSRQGLYLQFADKEQLFRRAVAHRLTQQLRAALLALSSEELPIDGRLVAACDEWLGRFIGSLGTDAADLMCASTSLAGGTLADFERRFENALVAAIETSTLAACCRAVHLSPADVARTLYAAARGLKHAAKSREDFVAGVTVAVRVLCSSLNRLPSVGNLRR